MNCNSDIIHVVQYVVDMQADASIEMERKHFYQESMKYVLLLQAVQERKKFEFVEIVSNLVTLCFFSFYGMWVQVSLLIGWCCIVKACSRELIEGNELNEPRWF